MAVSYDKIIKYKMQAVCTGPLHVGNAVGEKESVLIHPTDDVPFIQASGICGAFRSFYQMIFPGRVEDLFGAQKIEENENSYEYRSAIRFSDGVFQCGEKRNISMELRPRLALDKATGTVSSSKVAKNKVGHHFNMEYVGAGAVFTFYIYLYNENYKSDVEEMLRALHHEVIVLGGQKSNGCGGVRLMLRLDEKNPSYGIRYKVFDMKQDSDRRLWADEDVMKDSDYDELTFEVQDSSDYTYAYEIAVSGKVENELLVKSVAVVGFEAEKPDAVNIRNAKKEYIVPGSSFKGALRNQMERIAGYLKREDIIGNTFGIKASAKQEGTIGNIRVLDAVVGSREENDRMPLSYRIHLDKFTGGIMQSQMFTTKNITGKVNFKICIADRYNPKETCGLTLLALRDLAIGSMSVGSGYNVGSGIISVDCITIKNETGETAVLDFTNRKAENETMIKDCIQSVHGEGV